MKPFDLEAAKAGARVITRNGRTGRVVAYVPEAIPRARVLVMVDGDDYAMAYAEDGSFLEGRLSERDLFMPTTTRTVWLWQSHSDGGVWFDTENRDVRSGKPIKAMIEE